MKKIKQITIALALVIGFGAIAFPVPAGAAVNVFKPCTTANKDSAVCANRTDSLGSIIKNVINVLLYILGAVSVIMIIIGGLKYTTSNGDQTGVTSAKNTILYSVVGLAVAMSSFAIVNFVIKVL